MPTFDRVARPQARLPRRQSDAKVKDEKRARTSAPPLAAKPKVLYNLDGVPEPDRVKAWTNWIPSAFRGMEVAKFSAAAPIGFARRVPLGAAYLWNIVSSTQTLRGAPLPHDVHRRKSSLMLQQDGVSYVRQGSNECRLGPGDFCLIDANRPFEIDAVGVVRNIVFLFPSSLGAAQFPELLRYSAQAFPAADTETMLIRNLLQQVAVNTERLPPRSRTALFEALMGLIAALPTPARSNAPAIPWRVRQALEDIGALIDDRNLRASLIASRQNISRRRLDAMFLDSIGSTVTAQILERRLAQAASDLCDPGQNSCTITDIAFAAGFSDTAHFARAFRRRFNQSPSEWRQRH